MPIAAGKLRVLIATTNGPVEVLLLTEEDAAVGRCVACIGGTTETADIAAAYHAFVVRPTGIIESRFGHSCFRLDVSGRIDAGSSWQLGVLAAHALLAAHRLAQESDTADAVVWATGSVRPVDLTVGGVSHVPEKLANSLERLKQEVAAGRRVLIALPAANAAEVPPALAAELGIEVISLPHVQGLFDALAMTLPGSPHKAAAPPPVPALPDAAAAPRRRYAWAAAAVVIALLGAASATAFMFSRKIDFHLAQADPPSAPQPEPTPTPAANDAAPPPTPAPKTASVQPPPPPAPPAPQGPELVPETIPYISTRDRARVREEYLPAPDHKAIAISMVVASIATGHTSQEAADRAALEECERRNARPSGSRTTMRVCELYASGNVVVSHRPAPPMPPTPWVVHNPTIERPFIAAELPLVSLETKRRAAQYYRGYPRSKAFVIGPQGQPFVTWSQTSADDAVRRNLERCGYETGEACTVVAIDDAFVVPIPTSARAVGWYRPESLAGVDSVTRDEVARRLSKATEGWGAVAVGAGGQVGLKLRAANEQTAVDGALQNCRKHDRDCHVAVIGPFMVESLEQVGARRIGGELGMPTPVSSP